MFLLGIGIGASLGVLIAGLLAAAARGNERSTDTWARERFVSAIGANAAPNTSSRHVEETSPLAR